MSAVTDDDFCKCLESSFASTLWPFRKIIISCTFFVIWLGMLSRVAWCTTAENRKLIINKSAKNLLNDLMLGVLV